MNNTAHSLSLASFYTGALTCVFLTNALFLPLGNWASLTCVPFIPQLPSPGFLFSLMVLLWAAIGPDSCSIGMEE